MEENIILVMDSMHSLISILKSHVRQFPQAPFVTVEKTGVIYSYEDLSKTALRCAVYLKNQKIGTGDRIACVFENNWMIYPLLLASLMNRCSIIPLNPALHDGDFRAIFKQAHPKLVIFEDHNHTDLPKRLRGVSLQELMGQPQIFDEIDITKIPEAGHDDDPLLIIYSSGSTGQGKGIILTSRNLVVNAKGIATLYKIERKDVFFCVMPCYHMNALMITGMLPFVLGAHIILSQPFRFNTAKFYFNKVAQYKVNILSLTPSIMAVMRQIFPEKQDLSRQKIKFAFCGAAPLEETLWRAFEEHFNLPVYQGYGLTETTCWATMTPPDRGRSYRSVGVPVNCEIKINSSSTITPGEVMVKGPILMKSYLNHKRGVFQDGYFPTGDLGYFDANDELVISGRIKEIIIRNGMNIFPEYIDRALKQHPGVHDCATVGIADPIKGEAVQTAIIPKEEMSILDGSILRRWLQQHLSAHCLPDRICRVGYIPKTSTGKIKRHQLAEILNGTVAKAILDSINTRKYVRYHLETADEILPQVQKSVELAHPIRFVKYWGAGSRKKMTEVDRLALNRLREFLDRIETKFDFGASLTLIFTEAHALINGKDINNCREYFGSIADHASRLKFQCLSGNEIWKSAGLSVQELRIKANSEAFHEEWHRLSIREELIAQAAKHAFSEESEAIARLYYCANLHERALIAERFRDAIFLTYNRKSQEILLPNLPKIYLHSYKAKISEKPWFVQS